MRLDAGDGTASPVSLITRPATEPPDPPTSMMPVRSSPVTVTVIVTPSGGCSLSPGPRSERRYSPGARFLMTNDPSAFTLPPPMPNDELAPGPANSCVTLTDSPATGRPDE